MTFQGHVENGMIVLKEPIPLPDGTPVVVEAKADAAHFWRSHSLDELAQQQSVPTPRSSDDLLGGWPADEIDDNFEQELLTWRERELETHA
jgi:hypothetical protein